MRPPLSERNLRLLAKTAVCRWLSTSQYQQLFPNLTCEAVRKVLRRLTDARFLISFRPHRMAEALHAIGPRAKTLLEAQGLAVDAPHHPPRQLEHLIGINDIRLVVETEPKHVSFFFASWELGWTGPIIPDAVCAFRHPSPRVYAVEFDCGTEPLEMLARKLDAYMDSGCLGLDFAGVFVILSAPRAVSILTKKRFIRYGSIASFVTTLEALKTQGFGASIFRNLSDLDHPVRVL